MKDHDEGKAPEPNALVAKLFYLALAGVIAYTLTVYIYIGVLAP